MKIKNLFRAIKYVYKQAPGYAFASDFLFLISIVVEMAAIAIGGQFIDATSKILTEWKSFSIEAFFYSDAFWFLCISLVLWIILVSSNNARNYLKLVVYKRYLRKAQMSVINKISSENMQEIESKKFQDLLAYVPNYSIHSVYNAYSNFSELTRQLIRTVAAFAFLIPSMGYSVMFLLMFFAPEATIEFYYRRKIAKDIDNSMESIKLIYYVESFVRDIANFIELKVNHGFDFLRKIFKKNVDAYDNGEIFRSKHLAIDKTFFAVLGRVAVSAYVIYSLGVAVSLGLSIGAFKALYDYIMTSADSIYNMFTQLFQMLDSNFYIDKFFEFSDYSGFGDVSVGTEKLHSGTPTLTFQKLDFQYKGTSKKVLEDVNLKVNPGEKIAILGGDGSGKSTLVKVLCGLFEITAGDYVIGKYSVRELLRGELKSKLSLVNQDFNKYYLSIKENITIGDRTRINVARYERVKEICGITEFMEKEGIGENQRLGKTFDKGIEISPGYWQRIAIARALYRNRQILILDEPFLYIDQEARGKILKKIISFLGPDRSLICIFQEKENLELFDKVYSLKHGKVSQIKV